jgi:hypothetical protein
LSFACDEFEREWKVRVEPNTADMVTLACREACLLSNEADDTASTMFITDVSGVNCSSADEGVASVY